MDPLLTVLIMVACLLLEGFFSGSEIGVVSADPMKLRHKAATGSKGARLALKMLEKPEWLLSTTLVGTNIAVVTNTTMATALMIQLFGDDSSWLAVAVVAPLIWVFGEIVPKSIFQQRADSLTPIAIFALKGCSYLFFPILLVFSLLTRLLAKLAGKPENSPFTLREEISVMMDMSAEHGDIQPVEQSMIRRIFEFSEKTVQEAFVPLIDVIAVESGQNCGHAVRIASEKSHVRLPVYKERVDQVVGVLHTLDLLGREDEQPIADYVRPVLYVPGSKKIRDLLLELRQTGNVVAVVVDEFGGAEGIITVEDIMEEVVEDLEDEYDEQDEQDAEIRKLGEQDYLANARTDIRLLRQSLDIELPENGRYTTLGGFLLTLSHSIPKPGTEIEFEDIRFTIHRSTPQTIQEVRIRW